MLTETELERARTMFPLPDGIEDVIMNREQLALAFDVTVNTLSRWVKQGMPTVETGKRGTGYQFQPSYCYAWLKWRDASEKADQQRANSIARKLRAQFRNVEKLDDPTLNMTAAQVKAEADAEKARLSVAALRRQHVHTGDMEELIEDLFTIIRNSLETIPDYAEIEMSLTADDVIKLKGRCDQTLDDMRVRIASEFGPAEGLPS
jgi:phage terminase Nu1 subunit (DNA packaging protein)